MTQELIGPGTSLHVFAQPMPGPGEEVWETALPLDAFIAQATTLQSLWESARRLAQLDDAVRVAVAGLVTPVRLLALAEDWCGDAIHTLGVVERMREAATHLALRVVRMDDHPVLMDRHLSGASRSIPVIMALDAAGNEWGWWGPRPSPLQAWVKAEGLALESKERYRQIRTWYARDRGVTTAMEVLHLVQHAAGQADGASAV